MEFKDNLRALRLSKGITQDKFAEVLTRISGFDIKRSAVGNWEQGSRTPRYEVIEAIADYFNVNIDDLMGRCSDGSRLIRPTERSPEPVTYDDVRSTKKSATVAGDELSAEEKAFIAWLRALPPEKRQAVLHFQDMF